MSHRRTVVLFLFFVTFTSAVPALASRRRAVGSPPNEATLTATQWLQRKAVPFATAEARSGLADLEPLRAMVGSARIVSLGEATHGTREFFTMKQRILEYLVEEMGFTVFAIEANLPEADRVDDYVMNGEGDAGAALTGMYFWTWDTEEVLDQIEWMREYNLRRGNRPPVRFRGFDMQTITKAVPLVQDYVDRVDGGRAAEIRSLYNCIAAHRSNTYGGLSRSSQNNCRMNVENAHDLLAQRRDTYIAASSKDEYERILRYARVVVQAESSWTNRGRRDDFMAENVEWLADTLHPGEKMVLWAHNMHVAASEWWMMGSPLRQRFGAGMVIVGFAFDRGSFNAYANGRLVPNTIHSSPADGFEAYLAEARRPRFLLDLRNPSSPAAAALLGERRTIWTIGALWNEANRLSDHRYPVVLRSAFDILVYFQDTTASRLRR